MGEDRGESVAVVNEWGDSLIVEGDMFSHIEGNRRVGGSWRRKLQSCDLTNAESFYHGIVGTLADRGLSRPSVTSLTEQATQSER